MAQGTQKPSMTIKFDDPPIFILPIFFKQICMDQYVIARNYSPNIALMYLDQYRHL